MNPLSRRPLASIACAGMLSFGQPAGAASLQTITDVWAGNGNGDIGAGCTTYGPIPDLLHFFNGGGFVVLGGNTACGYTGVTANLTQATGPLQSSQTLPPVTMDGAGTSYGGSASARANYGSLGVAASGVFTGTTGSTSAVYSSSAAFFRDTLTASSPLAAPGSAGFVRYVFQVDGSLSTLGTSTGSARLQLNYQHATSPIFGVGGLAAQGNDVGTFSAIDGDSSSWTFGPGSVSGSGLFGTTLHIPFSGDLDQSFVWGVPWDLQVGLAAATSRNADASFLASAKLVDIQFFDAAHQRLNDFSLSSASGTDYLAAAVPEPASWALMALGVAWLGRRRCGRQRSDSRRPLRSEGEQS